MGFRKSAFMCAVVLNLFLITAARSEDLTVTTYYPSPNGSYDALLAKRFAVGDVNSDGSINVSDIPGSNGYLLVADKVGIGTASPSASLNTTYGIAIGSGSGVSSTDGNRRSLQFLTDTNYGGVYNSHSGYLLYSTMPGGWGTAQLNFAVSTNWGVYNTASPTMTLSAANVGIGTTSPGTLLHVYGNGGWPAGFRTEYSGGSGNGWNIVDGTDNNLYIGYGTSSAPSAKVVLQNGGNVGIGTTAPDTKLEVVSADSTSGLSYAGTLRISSSSPQLDFVDSDNNDWAIHVNSNKMYFIRDSWTYTDLVLNGSGNIGMGTDNPNSNMKLDVMGEICSSTLGAAGGQIRMIYGNYGCFIRNDGSNTYFLLTSAGNQYGSWNTLRPLYINNASGYVTFGNGHGDLAENYRISGTALRGSLMSIDNAVPSTAVKAGPSHRSLLGVVSTTPGAVMDTDGGFHIGLGTKKEYKNEKTPVVLTGAAPVLVTSHNGRISIGDPLGISPVPGFGAKAVSAGLTVGMALEPFPPKDVLCKAAASIEEIEWPDDNGKNSKRPCFKLPDGTYVGKIMSAVNVAWYDPDPGAAAAGKELIKEMRGSIAELNEALKVQQREIQTLKQEINRRGK